MALRLAAQSQFQRGIVPSLERIERVVRQLVTGDQSVMLVAEQDGRLVGMIGLMAYEHLLSGACEVAEVCWWVDVDKRGPGLGMALLWEAEKWTDAHGGVLHMMAPTRQFDRLYQRRGYRETGRMFERSVPCLG